MIEMRFSVVEKTVLIYEAVRSTGNLQPFFKLIDAQRSQRTILQLVLTYNKPIAKIIIYLASHITNKMYICNLCMLLFFQKIFFISSKLEHIIHEK